MTAVIKPLREQLEGRQREIMRNSRDSRNSRAWVVSFSDVVHDIEEGSLEGGDRRG